MQQLEEEFEFREDLELELNSYNPDVDYPVFDPPSPNYVETGRYRYI